MACQGPSSLGKEHQDGLDISCSAGHKACLHLHQPEPEPALISANFKSSPLRSSRLPFNSISTQQFKFKSLQIRILNRGKTSPLSSIQLRPSTWLMLMFKSFLDLSPVSDIILSEFILPSALPLLQLFALVIAVAAL